jgi:flavorubredoxin
MVNIISGSSKQFSWDNAKEKNSIEKMSKLDFNIMLPGHGQVLKANASEVVKEFLKSNEKT